MFSQIVEELLSDDSDSRGVTITGTPGSGKTTIMLQIVGRSCYGERVASAVCYLYQADNAGTCSDAVSLVVYLYTVTGYSFLPQKPHLQISPTCLNIFVYHNQPLCNTSVVAPFTCGIACGLCYATQASNNIETQPTLGWGMS